MSFERRPGNFIMLENVGHCMNFKLDLFNRAIQLQKREILFNSNILEK